MPTPRTITTTTPGKVTLHSDLGIHHITVLAEDRADGEITISTLDESAAAADLVQAMTLEATGTSLRIRSPLGGHTSVVGDTGGHTIVAGRNINIGGVFIAGDSYSQVNTFVGGVHAQSVTFGPGMTVVAGSATLIPQINVVARVPIGSSIDCTSVSGDIRTEGSLGEVSVDSTNGRVRIGTVAQVRVKTISGAIRVDHVTANGRLSSVSGDVEVYGDEDVEVHAKSVSGDILYGRNLDVIASTVSGQTRSVKAR